MAIRLRTQEELFEDAWRRFVQDFLGTEDMEPDAVAHMQSRLSDIDRDAPVWVQAAQITAILGIWDIALYQCDQCRQPATEIFEFDVTLSMRMVYHNEGVHKVCRKCLETALNGGAR